MTILRRAAYMRGAPDKERRRATFTAATENAVRTPYGREVLRMSGCDLSDYAKNPVVLDSHRRESIDDVIGTAEARVEGAELVADVDYLNDKDGDRAWAKVQAGAIRTVSVGYEIDPTSVRRVRAGETFEGVEGPAIVVGRWRLIEISNVPVPADADAVRRDFYTRALTDQDAMEDPVDDKPENEGEADERAGDMEDEAEREPQALAKDLIREAEELGATMDEIARACDRSPAEIAAVKSGETSEVPEDMVDALRNLVASRREVEIEIEDDSEDDGQPSEEPESEDEDMEDEGARAKTLKASRAAFVRSAPVQLRDLAEDVYLDNPRRSLTKVWRDVIEIAPSWAKEQAAELVRSNPTGTLEEHRKALIELRNKRSKPVGSGPAHDEQPQPNETNQRAIPQDFSGLF